MDDALFNRFTADDQLNSAAMPSVANAAFGRAYGQLVGVSPNTFLMAMLGGVVQLGAGSVGVDIIDLFRGDIGLLRAASFIASAMPDPLPARGDMMVVAGRAVADNPGVNFGRRVLPRLYSSRIRMPRLRTRRIRFGLCQTAARRRWGYRFGCSVTAEHRTRPGRWGSGPLPSRR